MDLKRYTWDDIDEVIIDSPALERVKGELRDEDTYEV